MTNLRAELYTPLTRSVPETEGSRWVIPDIHGCPKTLKALLDKLQPHTEDQLFFLGDFIDRGPDSAGVLDCLMELEADGYAVFPLRGNHEQMLLEELTMGNGGGEELRLRLDPSVNGLFDEQMNMKPKYWDYLNNLPFYYELEDAWLVHAGFNFLEVNPLEDLDSMLWIRNMAPHDRFLNGKRLLHGHTPAPLVFIVHTVEKQEQVINLDNGAVFQGKEEYGNLLALNLNSFELTLIPNCE